MSDKNIVPNYYNLVENETTYYNRKDGFPQHVALGIIIGQSGSGKTNCMYSLIVHNKNWDMFYICTKALHEPLYEMLINAIKKVAPDRVVAVDSPKDLPPINSLNDKIQNLVIFDDMICEDAKGRAIIQEWYIRGRKANASIFYLAQTYFDISKMIRLQANTIILKKITSKKELRAIVKDYALDMELEDLQKIYKQCTEGFDFFTINLKSNDPSKMYYHNFKPIKI